MKKLFFAITVLCLAACTPNNNNTQGSDGYVFSQKQFSKNPVTINVITYNSFNDLRGALGKINYKDKVNTSSVVAFSVLSPPNYDTCTIHMIDPMISYQPEFIGHEFLHCLYGQWHVNNNSNGQ